MLDIGTKASGQKTSLQRIVHPRLPDMACNHSIGNANHSIGNASCMLSLSNDCTTEARPSVIYSSQIAAELPVLDDHVGARGFDGQKHRIASREVYSSDSFGNLGIQQLHSEFFLTDQRNSSDRSSRVALLRERFAETICNAHEKQRTLLNPNDRAERQLLSKQLPYVQRRRWEKKGRSQDEARIFKWSLRNEKAKALAEARLRAKAELEMCMQQTVEIDENSGISNVLKRFESAFARHGRTPLERLGLFLKADADE